MIAKGKRITIAVLVAIPLIAILTAALSACPPAVAAGVGIIGAGALTATKYLHNRWLAAVGGLLAFSGVLAYALHAPPG